jgi:hypothetical protein
MSDDFQQTTWYYIPEHRTVHNECCENLKSYKPYAALLCYPHIHMSSTFQLQLVTSVTQDFKAPTFFKSEKQAITGTY